mgnify:CR=1 FL=1
MDPRFCMRSFFRGPVRGHCRRQLRSAPGRGATEGVLEFGQGCGLFFLHPPPFFSSRFRWGCLQEEFPQREINKNEGVSGARALLHSQDGISKKNIICLLSFFRSFFGIWSPLGFPFRVIFNYFCILFLFFSFLWKVIFFFNCCSFKMLEIIVYI